jgi:RNA recognition motif-containing protein
VGNLSYDTTEDDLKGLFSEVGQVAEVFVPYDRVTGRPRGFAFVEFAEEVAVAEAIQRFDGYELRGRNLRVSQAEQRQPYTPNYGGGTGARPRGPRRGSKPKGSRRNLRAKKRGF